MLKDATDHWQVWVASGRLTHPKKLTSGAADSGWAVWSPDGKTLAVRQQPDRSGPERRGCHQRRVLRCDPTDRDVTMLTDSKGLSGEPAWSPDGL